MMSKCENQGLATKENVLEKEKDQVLDKNSKQLKD